MTRFTLAATAGLVASLVVLGTQAPRAQDGITRTDLQKNDLSIPGREVIQQMVELQPGVVVARHTHPGEEVTVVLNGTLLLGSPAGRRQHSPLVSLNHRRHRARREAP